MLIDLHVHSRHSRGGSLDPAEVVRRAEELGLDGVCFTDLDTLAGVAEIRALRATSRLAVLVGLEVATDHGHYLLFFPKPEELPGVEAILGPRPVGKPWPVREVIERARARGGVVIAAHPYDRDVDRPAGDFVFTLKGLTAVEGLHGRKRVNVNELAIEAADHLSLPCVGGSGAATSLDELGTAATLFRDPVTDEAGLVAALRTGAVWAVAIGKPPAFAADEPLFRAERRGEGRPRGRDERRHGRRGGDRRRDERGGEGRSSGRGGEGGREAGTERRTEGAERHGEAGGRRRRRRRRGGEGGRNGGGGGE